jgi:hypothetical protein
MRITLPSEASRPLTPVEQENNHRALHRESLSVQLSAGGVLTIEGSGRYKVLPNGVLTSQNLTSISMTGENLEGARIQLRTQTVGHTITLVHGAGLRLNQMQDVVLTTPRSSLWLWHEGSGIWIQDSLPIYTD